MGRSFERREGVAREGLEALIRGLGPGAWEAFGDRFAFDADLILAVATRKIIGSGKPAAGIVCATCGWENGSVAAGRRASREGIWDPCPRCGEDGLSRFYVVKLRRDDLARALFSKGART